MRRVAVLAVGVAAVVLIACSSDTSAPSSASSSPAPDLIHVTTTPAQEAMVTKVVDAFRREEPSVQFKISTHGYLALTNAVAHREADLAVLPSEWLDQVRDDLSSGSFGRNLAVIALPASNPRGVI